MSKFRIEYTGKSKVIRRLCELVNDAASLGTHHDEAFYGDLGQTAYEHSQIRSGNPHNVTLKDLGIDHLVDQVNALLFTLGLQSVWITHKDEVVTTHNDEPILFRGIAEADNDNNLLWH